MSWRVTGDVAGQFDAVALLDHVTDVVMAQHLESITAGQKADGGGSQPALNPRGQQGRRAKEGQRPATRGHTGLSIRPFGPNIIRKKIRVLAKPVKFRRTEERLGLLITREVEATRARTTIEPDPIHLGWLAAEGERNVEYFYVDGFISHLVDIAIDQWFDVATDGSLKRGDKRERNAKKSKHKSGIFGV